MKRIAIFSLLALFLTTNYAYAALITGDVGKKIEQAQYGELTQEEAEELFIQLISTVDLGEVLAGDMSSLASVQPYLSTGCIVLLIITTLVTIFYPPLAPVFGALFAFFCR